MNYENLTDIEINARVSRTLYGDVSRGHQMELASGAVDYCNRIEDAWPIITENKISTMWMTAEKEWCAWSGGDLEEGCWEWENIPDYCFFGESPLRAAMIVFLMMQEKAQ